LSRAAYAKLQSANFPAILDRFGKPADVFDGNSYLQFDMQKEEADMLTCNQIIIQFLAFSRYFFSFVNSLDFLNIIVIFSKNHGKLKIF